MNTRSRIVLGVSLVLITVGSIVMVNQWIDHRFREGMAVAVQHKSMQHAPGALLSISRLPSTLESPKKPQRVRVCFSIDSFEGIAAEDRSFYEATERTRFAADGPRCEIYPVNQVTDSLKQGDPLEVDFTLENGGKISVYRLVVHGQDL
jgi:hypothetical protein